MRQSSKIPEKFLAGALGPPFPIVNVPPAAAG
jgi:hypothetical protein